VPSNKSRFDGLWCGGYVAYPHQLARESTTVWLPRRVDIRSKDLSVFGLNPPAEMDSVILEGMEVVTSRAEAIAKLAFHGTGQY